MSTNQNRDLLVPSEFKFRVGGCELVRLYLISSMLSLCNLYAFILEYNNLYDCQEIELAPISCLGNPETKQPAIASVEEFPFKPTRRMREKKRIYLVKKAKLAKSALVATKQTSPSHLQQQQAALEQQRMKKEEAIANRMHATFRSSIEAELAALPKIKAICKLKLELLLSSGGSGAGSSTRQSCRSTSVRRELEALPKMVKVMSLHYHRIV